MAKIALIHTTPVTVQSLQNLIKTQRTDLEIINLVDDSILPELINNNNQLDLVADRVNYYIKVAFSQKADLIMSACSSIGEIFEQAAANYPIPILRIDQAMADQAVKSASKIAVAATLETTLKPSQKLLNKAASKQGKKIELETALFTQAYQKLTAGDRQAHDQILAAGLQKLLKRNDLVVLAQASMARAVNLLPTEVKNKFLTSPESGIDLALSYL